MSKTYSIAIFCFVILSLNGIARAAQTITGTVRVLDGDSVFVRGKEIRLAGIDAPEWAQACRLGADNKWMAGQKAAARLRALAQGKTASCRVETRDRYGRFVSTCSVGGRNINKAMVATGWALAYRKYSKRYINAENRARERKIGIWAGLCQKPWAWRRANRKH